MTMILVVDPGPEAGRHPGVENITMLDFGQRRQVFDKNPFLEYRQIHMGIAVNAGLIRPESIAEDPEIKMAGQIVQQLPGSV